MFRRRERKMRTNLIVAGIVVVALFLGIGVGGRWRDTGKKEQEQTARSVREWIHKTKEALGQSLPEEEERKRQAYEASQRKKADHERDDNSERER